MQSIKKYGVEVIRFLCCCRCGRMEGNNLCIMKELLIKEELWLSMYESGLSSDFGEKMRITGIARKKMNCPECFCQGFSHCNQNAS